MRLNTALLMATFLTFASSALADEYVIMKVNNQDISSSEVQRAWEGLFPPGQAPSFETAKPDMREKLLRAVMAEKLIYSEALKQGVDKSPKLQAEFEDVKKKLIVCNLDAKTADSSSDADLKRDYDAMVSAMKDDKEVHARHILTSTEQEAKDAKKKIDSGKSFEEVAKDFSKDPGSAAKGGDLGYFTKGTMVKEFADAAFAMKKGEVSGPVKSGFGYHIIKVEDIRKAQPPTFAELKDQLRARAQEKKLNDYIGNLVKTAEVKTYDAKGKEVPFSKDMADTSKQAAEKAAEAKPAAKPAEPKPAPKPAKKPAAKPAEAVKPDLAPEAAPAEVPKPEPAAATPSPATAPAGAAPTN